MFSFEHVLVEQVEKSIVILRANRPYAKNALNGKMVEEIISFIDYFTITEDLKVLILTGNEEDFIAGADIREMMGISVSDALKIAKRMKLLHEKLTKVQKPIIAAIEGYCLGGGFELALACDIKIAGNSAKFGLPEVKLGIIPGGGGTQRLLNMVGPSVTNKLVLTGEIISAKRAYELKIVSDLVDNPLEKSIEVAQILSKGSSCAIATAKQLITGLFENRVEPGLQEELNQFSILFDYPDSVEGLSAFIEKRKPQFR
ncbi:enoyl-CoA hydratase/isomerase family protein [Neobacillus drentensis]|uniref:enoyl-CoA hydratase/isomerase family protein n=1 Tax=Neobacillus drentensis TaxID=220684 RepID=UPI0008243EE7|nr:enoyl-CoA hydratase-related protein [Neobacillus drentensis]